MTVGDTPEYHWDTGYDGIQGFSRAYPYHVDF